MRVWLGWFDRSGRSIDWGMRGNKKMPRGTASVWHTLCVWSLSFIHPLHQLHAAAHTRQSQRLKVPLSTVGRLLSSEYALYTLADEEGRALGFIKLGRKCLYVTVRALVWCLLVLGAVCVLWAAGGASARPHTPFSPHPTHNPPPTPRHITPQTHKQNQNPGGMMIQVKPLCVLDFYVHGSVQRRGLGARLLAQACKVHRGGV